MRPESGDAIEALAESVHGELLSRAEAGSSVETGCPRSTELSTMVRRRNPLVTDRDLARVIDSLESRTVGLGRLDRLLADPGVDEVMVNGGGEIWIERDGCLHCTGDRLSEQETNTVIERIIRPLGLHVDRMRPMVDARLPDGSRVNAIVPPLSIDGPVLTVRRFGSRRIELGEMADRSVVAILDDAVLGRANVVVSGGAGAGKTTVLNALASTIPDSERVITIEDAAELRLPGRHVVRLESRPASAEGVGEVRIRDLVRNALRMRPDRIVVGEIRAGEAIDMLQAMNTGHDGSITTCHANSPVDALRRLETLSLMGDVALPLSAIREQIRSAIDLVVHVERGVDGSRRIASVGEVDPVGDVDSPLAVSPLVVDGVVVAHPRRPARRPARRPVPARTGSER